MQQWLMGQFGFLSAYDLFALYMYKCKKKLNSLKQCLTATRPTSHN